MVQSKLEISEKNRIWREANPDYQKAWKAKQDDWKALKSTYNKTYYKTDSGRKKVIIAQWKRSGLIHNNYDALYNIYINTHSCMICETPFKTRHDRQMDHNHSPPYNYRQMLCHKCNCHDAWMKVLIP